MTSLNPLGWKIHNSLKANRPMLFAELQAKGTLLSTVKAMEISVNEQLSALEDAGMQPFEAEEMVRDQIYLPSEEDVPNLGETMQPYTDYAT